MTWARRFEHSLLATSILVAACSGGEEAEESGSGGAPTGGNMTGGMATGGATGGFSALGGTGGMSTGGTPTTGGSPPTGGWPTGGATTGGTATGGAATGGQATGGTSTGGVATGGQATGGTATGGQATGGAAAGGQAAGGTATGGAATGGALTGGAATGGEATGGASTGGTSTGGAATGGAAGSGGYPLGNPPVPSTGCGESPSLTSGTHYMSSGGLEREYILSLPDNYDPNTPYRLVFGMHWMGGSAGAVNNDGWYRLKPFDTGNTTIWVAPQGYTDSWPWRGSDDLDHIFFEELFAQLTSDLCIDTSRVFSIGFSFGAMYTNALAQTHQNILRGVVVYATADYNIYFPDNTGEPLAYMGVHGLTDGTCPFDSGQRSKDRFVDNNGCTQPSSVPEAQPGGNHVVYDYEGCGIYPVKWCTFDGGHTDQPTDGGQSWVPQETWDFISQF